MCYCDETMEIIPPKGFDKMNKIKYYIEFLKLMRYFKQKNLDDVFTKTTYESKKIYDDYGKQELENTVNNYRYYINKMNKLDYLIKEICKYDNPKVLEVGCGNCLNLQFLNRHINNNCKLYGIDISFERIKTGYEYFKDCLQNVELSEASALNIPYRDNYFDIVYTYHCLEQIPYRCNEALNELYRVCKKTIILIEPVFENMNSLQRIYNYHSDHNRVLLKMLNERNANIRYTENFKEQLSPVHNSTLIIIDKKV